VSVVPTYLVEVYAPRGTDISELVADARAAEGELRHLRSIFVPEDEICFHLFSAPALASAPKPRLGRLVEVVEEPPSRDQQPHEQQTIFEPGKRGRHS
jgi:hypothetical protein